MKTRIWEGNKNVGVQIKAERKVTGENFHGKPRIKKDKSLWKGRENEKKE